VTGSAHGTAPKDPVLLLDSASLWFRAFHGLPESITGRDGQPVNAIHGFLDTCSRLLTARRPRGLVCCLDADWRPAFRVAALPSYKAHRATDGGGEQVPEALVAQIPALLGVARALGLATAELAGFEADDVIAVLAARLAAPVEIVSGDRDLFQLAGAGVSVLYTVQGLRRYQADDVAQRFDIPPGTYADFAILRGDSSDGLPGVAGVGDKTASMLLRRFGSLDALLGAARSGDPAVGTAGARVLAAADSLAAAETVVRLRTDLPVPEVDPALPAGPAQPVRLAELSDQLGLDGPVGRLAAALGWTAPAAASSPRDAAG
jgi:5'-3' exonuclease